MTAYPRIAAHSFRASAAETAVQVCALGRTAARRAQAFVDVHAFLLRVAVITLGTLAFVPACQVDAQRAPPAGAHVIALVDIDTLRKIEILSSKIETQILIEITLTIFQDLLHRYLLIRKKEI